MSLGISMARARAARGMTQNDLAEKLLVSQNTVSDWENDRSKPRRKLWADVKELLGIDIEEFISGEFESPGVEFESYSRGTSVKVPLVGMVGAGGAAMFFDDHAKGAGFDYVDAPVGTPEGAIAVQVRGRSLYPLLREGGILVYSRQTTDIISQLHNLVICRLEDGQTFVKTVERGSAPGFYNLVSVNAPVMEDVVLQWVSPIDCILPPK